MKISKIKIKNLFGISEYETDNSSIELSGKNGVGKSSVIDAIRYALTNKSNRDYIVRNGETEGEIIIETDNGLKINRKARTNQADYKSIKKDGREVGSPESFLKDIFTNLQLNPVEFMAMDKNKQNAIILDMIEYEWDVNSIKNWFGEIPAWVSYDQNILGVLNDIQSEKGEYFMDRQNINRDIRNKRAFIEEIGASLPDGYNSDRWENASTAELYKKIETIRHENDLIEKSKAYIEASDNKIRGLEAQKQINISAIEQEFSKTETRRREQISSLEEQLVSAKKELAGLNASKADKIELANKEHELNMIKFNEGLDKCKQYAEKQIIDVSELVKEAEQVEEMKSFINEYKRMLSLEDEVKQMQEDAGALTRKIEKARTLPGEILRTAKLPIKGLTVKDGIPVIKGLPISNLSDGEKLDLCIDVALKKPNGLQIILIDGVEKLAKDMRDNLYKKCKEKGLQFIATRTTDDADLTVIEI